MLGVVVLSQEEAFCAVIRVKERAESNKKSAKDANEGIIHALLCRWLGV